MKAWSPNGFELTGAGLTPRCLDDNEAAGVRCSEGSGDGSVSDTD